jgi:hypothetical protein
MKTTIGKLAVFLLLIAGIFGYMRTGVDLFEKIKNGTINIELRSIDRQLLGVKLLKGKFPMHFKKFMSESFETKSNKKVGTDPWGKDYHYKVTLLGYSIVSNGPDKVFGNNDDIIATREKDSFNINVSAGKADMKTKPTALVANNKTNKNKDDLISELMVYLDISKLERPFDQITDEDLAKEITRFLRDYGYE